MKIHIIVTKKKYIYIIKTCDKEKQSLSDMNDFADGVFILNL